MACFKIMSFGDIKEFCLMHLLKMFWYVSVKVLNGV